MSRLRFSHAAHALHIVDHQANLFEEMGMFDPPLRLLHSAIVLSQAKLLRFRAMGTADLIESLRPGRPGALVTRPDGTVLEGNHRLAVLQERGIEIDRLPRDVRPRDESI